jgi:carbon storage regulator
MLVLARFKGERIRIGSDITIEVVDIRGNKARIGIDAPASVPVHREEVAAAIAREGSLHPPKGMVLREALLEANKEAEDLLARVAFGEYIDPATIQGVIDRLKLASGEVSALEWDNARKSRLKSSRRKEER